MSAAILSAMADLDDFRAATRLMNVSRETLDRLIVYVNLVQRWQKVKNLVSEKTLPKIWTRHIADSAQILNLAPDAKSWADLGSGAGFPGLVIAIQLLGKPNALVHLIESDHRKCAFLRDVIRETGAPALVYPARTNVILPNLGHVDAITARGFASLSDIIQISKDRIKEGTIGVFPRGQHIVDELTKCAKYANLKIELFASKTQSLSRIAVVKTTDNH